MSPEKTTIRSRVTALIRETEVENPERTTNGLEELFLRLAYHTYSGPIPPEYVYHVGQVKTVTEALLSHTDRTEQEWGKRYSLAHDIGRAVDLGPAHTRAGARILYEYGYDSSLVTYTLAHHRWGLGVPILTPDLFPVAVEEALANGNVDHIMDEIVAKRGIAALAVLLADNSKRPVAPGSYETEIFPFNLDQAEELIGIQIARGRYTRDSREHIIDDLGARFLSAMIPHLEKRLDVRYAPDDIGSDVISRARTRWPEEKEKVLAKWQEIHHE
jgi:hypothetical protein